MGIIRDFFLGSPRVERQTDETATEDVFQSQISNFWANLSGAAGASNPMLLERVWVANVCQQMTADAISTMPLRHYGLREPAWVSNPDPNWYPNGIEDAVFSIVWSYLGWGDAFVYITSRYADGYPSNWTVLDPASVQVESRGGRRVYRLGNSPLDETNMIQISRDPRGGLRGTSVIKSCAAYTNGLLASADLGRVMMETGTPSAVLKSSRKITEAQASALQTQWMSAVAARRGAPAVLPPEIDFEKLAFSAEDLQLLAMQKFDAQVVAAVYRVPGQLVNMALEGGLNYSTPVLMLVQWWRTALRPLASRISTAFSTGMLPRSAYVAFDAREFLAPTFSELATALPGLVEKGILTPEEAHTILLDRPPEEASIQELMSPPSAGASPAQQPSSSVVALRPTAVSS